jgi:hypothetical protein
VADERELMRAADSDREAVLVRLRVALDEGRLKMDEYLERMGLAQEAVTYGDLAKLQADLPLPSLTPKPVPGSRPASPVPRNGWFARLPVALKVLWTIWGTAVAINLVVWAIVSATAHLVYFWPIWVIGPAGAALFAVSAAIMAGRRGHDPAPRPLPPSSPDT